MVGITATNGCQELGNVQQSMLSGSHTNAGIHISQVSTTSHPSSSTSNKDPTSSTVRPKCGSLATQFLDVAEKLASGKLQSSDVCDEQGRVVITVKPVRPAYQPAAIPPPQRSEHTTPVLRKEKPRMLRDAVSQILKEADKWKEESRDQSCVYTIVVSRANDQSPARRSPSPPRFIPPKTVHVTCSLDNEDIVTVTKGRVKSNERSLQQHLKAYIDHCNQTEVLVEDQIPMPTVSQQATKRQGEDLSSSPSAKTVRLSSNSPLANNQPIETSTVVATQQIPEKQQTISPGNFTSIPKPPTPNLPAAKPLTTTAQISTGSILTPQTTTAPISTGPALIPQTTTTQVSKRRIVKPQRYARMSTAGRKSSPPTGEPDWMIAQMTTPQTSTQATAAASTDIPANRSLLQDPLKSDSGKTHTLALGEKKLTPVTSNILFDKKHGPYVLEWFKTNFTGSKRAREYSCALCPFKTRTVKTFWSHVEMHLK